MGLVGLVLIVPRGKDHSARLERRESYRLAHNDVTIKVFLLLERSS